MGIQVTNSFVLELSARFWFEKFNPPMKSEEECIPKNLQEGQLNNFKIKGLYNFPIQEYINLLNFHHIWDSEVVGAVKIVKTAQLRESNREYFTSGTYHVLNTRKDIWTPKIIKVEFNSNLALRNISQFNDGERSLKECIPEHLEKGKTYDFLKQGQRNYWLDGEIPLLQTEGEGKLSRPLASALIDIVEHFGKDGEVWTSGKYTIIDIFDPKDSTIHFEAMERIRKGQ